MSEINQIVELPLESQIIALATVIIKGREGMAVVSEVQKLDAR